MVQLRTTATITKMEDKLMEHSDLGLILYLCMPKIKNN